MDVYNTIQFRKEVNGNLYVFSMTVGSPYGEAYDAMCETLQTLVKLAQEHAQKMLRQEDQKENRVQEESVQS